MLDLPELDDMVCRQLGRHELVQCSLVSKKWHSIVVPHLWRDLSWINEKHVLSSEKPNFFRILQEDYLAKQRYDVEQSTQAQSSPPLSTLSKYGHWIQLLPDPTWLQRSFPEPAQNIQTSCEMILHLLGRCSPEVQVAKVYLYQKNIEQSNTILDFALPRVRHLHINIGSRPIPVSKLMNLLDQCSTTLEKLVVNIAIPFSGVKDDRDERTENEQRTWTSLKKLSVINYCDGTDTEAFLSWLLGKCSNVERLYIHAYSGSGQSFARGMSHMPCLFEIHLGCSYSGCSIPDDTVATILHGSRNGWKAVGVWHNARFREVSMKALSNHFSTLEVLKWSLFDRDWSNDLVQVLRSCTQLHTFAGNDCTYRPSSHLQVDAKAFIDPDPVVGSLRPWKCETSLQVLKVAIIRIPRPDVQRKQRKGVIKEKYLGQGREIQSQVYDRLARLTNLETLWLESGSRCQGAECLEMSLESGLNKLSGLKKLKELYVVSSETKIGVKEVQWMVENWPRLLALRGLNEDKGNREAVRWLRENHPGIEVTKEQVPVWGITKKG